MLDIVRLVFHAKSQIFDAGLETMLRSCSDIGIRTMELAEQTAIPLGFRIKPSDTTYTPSAVKTTLAAWIGLSIRVALSAVQRR